jgi:antitoxin MazE
MDLHCTYFITKGGATMRARVIKIGNSRGIRIPKALLEQTGIRDDVEIELADNHLCIRPVATVREGWDSAFRSMGQSGDDTLDLADQGSSASSWDIEEWQW